MPQTDRAYLSGGLAGKVAMRAATRAILVSASVLSSMLLGYRIGMAAKPSHCAKDCKQDIKNCLGLVPPNKNCTGTRAEKKACRKNYAKLSFFANGKSTVWWKLPPFLKRHRRRSSRACIGRENFCGNGSSSGCDHFRQNGFNAECFPMVRLWTMACEMYSLARITAFGRSSPSAR